MKSTICSLLCLPSFTYYNVSDVYPCHSMYQDSFLWLNNILSYVSTTICLSIYISWWNLVCFQFWSVMNNTVWTLVDKVLCNIHFYLFWLYTWKENCWVCCNSKFNFLKHFHRGFQSGYIILHSCQQCLRLLISHILVHSCYNLFFIMAILVSVKWDLIVFFH